MTAPSQAAQDIESFFSGGAKTAKFEDKDYGRVIGGTIVEDPVMRQQRDYETDELMVYPDGNPQMQMLVTVQALPATDDDDGRRTFYIRGQLRSAVGDALRKVGEKAPRKGGKLWVKYVSDEPVVLKNGKRGSDKKIHIAKYEPPAQVAAAGFYDEADAKPAGSVFTTPEAYGPRAVAQPANQGGASNGQTPAAGLTCPPGVPPVAWSAMSPDQQRQMHDALTAAMPAAQPAEPSRSAPRDAFPDEVPF